MTDKEGSADHKIEYLPIKNKVVQETFKFNFTICISNLFGDYNNVLQFAQAMEMYKLLGVQHVVVYKTSCGPDLEKLLKHYETEGILEIVSWPIDQFLNPSRGWNIKLHKGEIQYYGQLVTLNECIYRHMYQSKYLLLNDIDEIIMPYKHSNLPSLMEDLQPAHPNIGVFLIENHIFPKTQFEESGKFKRAEWKNIPGRWLSCPCSVGNCNHGEEMGSAAAAVVSAVFAAAATENHPITSTQAAEVRSDVVSPSKHPGSHSLMVFATYVTGQTPFPEFTLVLMLDDVQVLYYDSVSLKAIHRSQSNPSDYNGLHVYQKHVGCELLDNDQPGLFLSLDALNGQNTEEFTFDVVKRTMQINLPWMRIKGMGQIEWLHVKFLYEHVYHPVCLKTLRTFLEKEKNTVMRKYSLGSLLQTLISCLATGFYPRHINLTLFRDGQPVDDDQITGGEILPNGDGTYQMRKSLVISSEELREGHKYNCTIKHLNLDNKLDIAFGKEN
ncbi:hypothetical protein Q8A67_010192 [Cirrhinus molitorella]|uniref:Glycosyltransferase family 92 protein n=1 Tax=Cirrhinus molitorella TaxID=172907 RepID=A0AA88PRW7_9TELE|nr:hypothetical protein Q8A67_010192 [Cirrhinus molitorella]